MITGMLGTCCVAKKVEVGALFGYIDRAGLTFYRRQCVGCYWLKL